MSVTASPSGTPLPNILVTTTDLKRLRDVIERGLFSAQASAAELLEQELDRADVVESAQVPADVVTMRSRVLFEDVGTGRTREFSLVYPAEADLDAGKLSVLTPVGAALLGLRVGASIDWPLPGGRTTRFQVKAVPYQPEAAGDFDL